MINILLRKITFSDSYEILIIFRRLQEPKSKYLSHYMCSPATSPHQMGLDQGFPFPEETSRSLCFLLPPTLLHCGHEVPPSFQHKFGHLSMEQVSNGNNSCTFCSFPFPKQTVSPLLCSLSQQNGIIFLKMAGDFPLSLCNFSVPVLLTFS